VHKLLALFSAVVKRSSGQSSGCTGVVKRANWMAVILSATFLSAAAVAAVDMTAEEVLADGCSTTPGNFFLSGFWETKMGVLEAWCQYPAITKSDLNEKRKPQVFAHGSSGVPHDVYAVKIVNGTGESDDTLGIAPRTTTSLGLYCSTGVGSLEDAKAGDAVFTLRDWSDTCSYMSTLLPTIPIFGEDNTDKFVGDEEASHGIQVSSGGNYGLAIDYFLPGGASTIVGGGNVSFGQTEFAGIVAALNTALVSNNYAVLTIDTIKEVLNASSDEVYLKVNGYPGIYNESEVDAILQAPNNSKYYGQIVNLSNAIDYALSISSESMFLTIIKAVINDDGGDAIASDFTLRVTGGNYDGTVPRSSGDRLAVVEDVAYSLSEFFLQGYVPTGVECKDDDTGDELTMDLSSVTLSVGQSATCTISNDDIAPELNIYKVVDNKNDGELESINFVLHLKGGTLQGSTYDGTKPLYSGDKPAVEANAQYTLSDSAVPL